MKLKYLIVLLYVLDIQFVMMTIKKVVLFKTTFVKSNNKFYS